MLSTKYKYVVQPDLKFEYEVEVRSTTVFKFWVQSRKSEYVDFVLKLRTQSTCFAYFFITHMQFDKFL